MKWLQMTYKSLSIIIVMHIVLVVTGCSNTSQPNKHDSIKLSEVVGDKITIQICNKVISIPKKPIGMIRSFIASNPPGYHSVQVSLVPVDEVYLDFEISKFNNIFNDAYSPFALIVIYCDERNNDKFYSIPDLKLIKVNDLPELGLSQFKVENPRTNLEVAFFFPLDIVNSSDGFYFTCSSSNYNKDFDSCEIRGSPIKRIGMGIKFSDLRDWREYKEVFESLISIEVNDGKSH